MIQSTATVYLDTTILSYLVAPTSTKVMHARQQRITRIWWSRYRYDCDLFYSDCVFEELRNGREDEARKRLEALERINAVRLRNRSEALVESLLADGLIPPNARADAEHIAYASSNSVQFLLTWSCKHLANRAVSRRVRQRCESHGLRCPRVCTPETLVRLCAYERHPY